MAAQQTVREEIKDRIRRVNQALDNPNIDPKDKEIYLSVIANDEATLAKLTAQEATPTWPSTSGERAADVFYGSGEILAPMIEGMAALPYQGISTAGNLVAMGAQQLLPESLTPEGLKQYPSNLEELTTSINKRWNSPPHSFDLGPPKTKTGQVGLEFLGNVGQGVDDIAYALGAENPLAATVIKTGAEMLPIGRPLKKKGGTRERRTENQLVAEQAIDDFGYDIPVRTEKPLKGGGVFSRAVDAFGHLNPIVYFQNISHRNQKRTQDIFAERYGLGKYSEGGTRRITVEELIEYRRKAGEAYARFKESGAEVEFGDKFRSRMQQILADWPDYQSLSKQAQRWIDEAAEWQSVDPKQVMELSTELQRLERSMYAAEKGGLGTKLSQINGLIDAKIASHTKKHLPDSENILQARQKIAESYSVENALNSDGLVDLNVLAKDPYYKNRPKSSELTSMTRAAAAFPDSFEAVSAPTKPLTTSKIGEKILGPAANLAANLLGGPMKSAAQASATGRGMLGNEWMRGARLPKGTKTGLLGAGAYQGVTDLNPYSIGGGEGGLLDQTLIPEAAAELESMSPIWRNIHEKLNLTHRPFRRQQ